MAAGDVTCDVVNPIGEQAAYFDGVDDLIDFGATIHGLRDSSEGTLSCWVYVREGITDNGGIISKSTGGGAGAVRFDLVVRTGGNFRFYLGDSVGFNNYSGTPLIYNSWVHVVATWDGTNINMYVNNGSPATYAQTREYEDNPARSLRMGQSFGSTAYPFDGGIRDVRLFTRAITAAEVETLYNGGKVKDGLANHWPLAGDYKDQVGGADGTPNGTSFSAFDDNIAEEFEAARVTANDKYFITKLKMGTLTTHIEEA